MKNNSLAILIFLAFILVAKCQNNYCNFQNCNHTLCVYPTEIPSNQCTNILAIGLTDSEKQRILNAHNTFRQKVASGFEARGNPGPQPAGNIPNLVWNDEIASIAQRWAEQCNPKTDICRRTAQYSYVNQNIATKDTSGDVNTIEVEDFVKLWTDRVINFDRNTVSNFRFDRQSASYSQLVWAKTTSIGCGAIKYVSDGWNRFFLVCNYAPGGNIIGQRVY